MKQARDATDPVGKTIKVIYIAGAAHCGSTFMDIVLGDCESFFSTGQIAQISGFIRENGEIELDALDETKFPIWKEVLGQLTTEERLALKRVCPLVFGERRILRFLFSRALRRQYADAFRPLFSAIHNHDPSMEVIIDSSKNITRAIALTELRDFDVHVLHLVRDGRGYLSSKLKRFPDENTLGHVFKHTLYWTLKNVAARLILPPLYKSRFVTVRYEDFVSDPKNELGKIADAIGVELDDQFLSDIQNKSIRGKQILTGNKLVRALPVHKFDRSNLERNVLPTKKEIFYQLSGGFIGRLWKY